MQRAAIEQVILDAAEARGRTLTEHAVSQYCDSLTGVEPAAAEAALSAMFKRERTFDMPTPKAIIDEISAARAKARRHSDDLSLTPEDRTFGLAYAEYHDSYFDGKITRAEMYLGAVACARLLSPEKARTTMAAIDYELGDWRNDQRKIHEAGRLTELLGERKP